MSRGAGRLCASTSSRSPAAPDDGGRPAGASAHGRRSSGKPVWRVITKALRPLATLGGSSTGPPVSMRRLLILLTAALGLLLPGVLLGKPDGGGPTFAISGFGWGHGVGMSQCGAYGFAKNGRGYREILAHYYRGTEIGKVSGPPDPRPSRRRPQLDRGRLRVRLPGRGRVGSSSAPRRAIPAR